MDDKSGVPGVERDSHDPLTQNFEAQLTPDPALASNTRKSVQPSKGTMVKNTETTRSGKDSIMSKTLSKFPRDISRSSNDDPSSESSSSLSSSSLSESEEYTDSSSDDEATKQKQRARLKKVRKLKEEKAIAKRMRGKVGEEEETSHDLDDGPSSSEGKTQRKTVKAKKAKKLKAMKKSRRAETDEDESDSSDEGTTIKQKKKRKKEKQKKRVGKVDKKDKKAKEREKNKLKKLKGTKADFVRTDRIWDVHRYMFVEKPTVEDKQADAYDQYAFNVRRIFDSESQHTRTVVDIKSKELKAALVHVMGEVKGISLAEDTPSLDPDMIFLHVPELREYMKELKSYSKSENKKKKAKAAAVTSKHLKVLIKYLDKDYDKIKKTLYPMLANNTITFELLWALFKSNDIAYTPTYGTEEVPRAFKIEYSNKVCAETVRNLLVR